MTKEEYIRESEQRIKAREEKASIAKAKMENNASMFNVATGIMGMILLAFGNDLGLLFLIPAFVSIIKHK